MTLHPFDSDWGDRVDVDANTISPARYSTVAIVLHWAIAALLVFEVGLGLNMDDARGAAKFTVFQLHKSVGITILLLVTLRVLWRLMRRPPPLGTAGWERALALIVHGLFYILLFALPLSGWLIVSTSKIAVPTLLYGSVPWPHLPGFASMEASAKQGWNAAGEFVHHNLVNLLYALVALHVAGALKHHFVDRDGDMARMTPGVRTGSWSDPRLLGVALVAMAAAALGLTWAHNRSAPVPPPVARVAPMDTPLPKPVQTAAPVETVQAAATPDEPSEEKAVAWTILPGATLHFRTSMSGDAIAGGFANFSGDIVFGADDLANSRATITIQTGSVFSGDSSRDETLKDTGWFAASANPAAVFRTTRFRKTGNDRYVADGSLKIKGMTAPVTLPFTLKIDGDVATMRGSATVDRLTYKLGEDQTVADIPAKVAIDIALKARRK